MRFHKQSDDFETDVGLCADVSRLSPKFIGCLNFRFGSEYANTILGIPKIESHWINLEDLVSFIYIYTYENQGYYQNWLVVSIPLKNMKVISQLGKLKNVPNHQPENL